MGILNTVTALWKSKPKMAKCGHRTLTKGIMSAFGEIEAIEIRDKDLPFCVDCLAKMAIQCAWCKRPIFIGNFVTLYNTAGKKDFVAPKHAVVYSKDPLALVGCQRTDCAHSGSDYLGYWIPPGQVMRIESTIERSIRTGRAVIRNGHKIVDV